MKKILSVLATGALGLSLLAPTASFAADTVSKTEVENNKPGIHRAFKQNLADHKRPEMKLDDATKAKLTEIREKVKVGELTKEQAKAEIEGLGIKFPDHKKPEMKIDEATKAKLTEIREKVKAGELTKEQAKTQMEELGIKNFGPGKNFKK
ncbi:hypothetical protein SAMN00017405_0980 [Desulfonispora thiosulfatigenes DSM 11270]|uniref:Short C-terminal domain-containing protein n=1 Tax=Desulfonispora thiosulfatigenes DSM 11270 TaxID=656914 RepID=A0A1W1UPG7_DESTI|nr:hypothetical protein [Desulfonispora thiosulfatigenes]SMB82923.1 hypothetical protein SAMN00017405_0980 [Desulfonispora thiosulfatigenes DSM 11270]